MANLKIMKTTRCGLETYEIHLNSRILYTFLSRAMALTKYKMIVNRHVIR